MDTDGVEVFHVADRDAVIERIAHHFVLHFLPALQRFFHQNLVGSGEGFLGQRPQLVQVVGKAAAQPAQRERRPHDDGEADFLPRRQRVVHRCHGHAAGRMHANLVELDFENFPVLGVDDALNGRAQHLHVVLLEHAGAVQGHGAVQRRLAAKGHQNAIGLLLFDDFLHEVGCHGQEVHVVGHVVRRLHGGNVGVDEDGADAFLLQRLEGLGAGIIELPGLADFEGPGTEDENFVGFVHYEGIVLFERLAE